MRFWKPLQPPSDAKVGIAVAAYLNEDPTGRLHHGLQALVHSLKAQTHQKTYVHIVHDGLYAGGRPALLPNVYDAGFFATEKRAGEFGHPHRQAAVDWLRDNDCDWIGLTNQDNYYAPTYLEWMLWTADQSKALLVYCDFVHSHKRWKPIDARPVRGKLDLGGFLVHESLAAKVKFDKFTFAGDADYFERLVKAARGRVAKVSATLFVHN